MVDVNCFPECLANGFWWYFSFQDQIQLVIPFWQLAIFICCYAARSNEAIAIKLKRKAGLVDSPQVEGTRLADQSRKHPFAQLNSLSLNIYFNSLAAGLWSTDSPRKSWPTSNSLQASTTGRTTLTRLGRWALSTLLPSKTTLRGTACFVLGVAGIEPMPSWPNWPGHRFRLAPTWLRGRYMYVLSIIMFVHCRYL